MTSTVFRGLVGVLGVVTAIGTTACEGELEETEVVDEAEAAITVDEPVLVNGVCVTHLAPADAARLERAEDILEMTAAQRAALGVKKISTSALPADQRRAISVLAGNPCEVEGDISCVSGTSDNGARWVMCTDGFTTCGVSSSGSWCNP